MFCPHRACFNKTVDRRKRIGWAERDVGVAYRIAPEMREMHEISATTFEECWPLFSNSCTTLNNDLAHGLVPYGDYLLGHDMRTPYREYKRQLKMLLFQRPARRLLPGGRRYALGRRTGWSGKLAQQPRPWPSGGKPDCADGRNAPRQALLFPVC